LLFLSHVTIAFPRTPLMLEMWCQSSTAS